MSVPATRAPYPFADSVARQVKRARISQGLSLNKLAGKAAVSRRHLAELEKGSNVTLLVARNAMRALGLTALMLDDDLQLAIAVLSEAAARLELGAALILDASADVRAAARGNPPTEKLEDSRVRNELATKAATLIKDFEAHVNSLDSADKVEALSRLVQASLVPVDGPAAHGTKRRKRSA